MLSGSIKGPRNVRKQNKQQFKKWQPTWEHLEMRPTREETN
jgi:hypothetical protein